MELHTVFDLLPKLDNYQLDVVIDRCQTIKNSRFDEFERREEKNEKARQRIKLKENENFIKFKSIVKPGDIVQCSGTRDRNGYRLVEKCDDFCIWGWKLRMIGKEEWHQTGDMTQNGYGKIKRIIREK